MTHNNNIPSDPGSPLVPGNPCPATTRYRAMTATGDHAGREYDCRKDRTMPPTPGKGQWFDPML